MKELQLEIDLLKNVPIFRSLSDDLLKGIISAPENGIEEYEPKSMIIREAEIGDCMYVILTGAVEVLIRAEASSRDISIATLRPGDFFGERSLMPGSTGRRNATVKAMFQTKVFRIDKKYVFLSVKRDDFHLEDDEDVTAINFANKKAAEPEKPKPAAPPAAKPQPKFPPDEVRDMVMKLRIFKSLNRSELESIHNWTEVTNAGPGEFILKESQPGDAMFIILNGTVDIFTLDNDGKIVVLAKLNPGDYFGEQALMPDSRGKRNAFARSDKEARLIKIPKEYFRLVLNRDNDLFKELKQKHSKNTEQGRSARQS